MIDDGMELAPPRLAGTIIDPFSSMASCLEPRLRPSGPISNSKDNDEDEDESLEDGWRASLKGPTKSGMSSSSCDCVAGMPLKGCLMFLAHHCGLHSMA